MLLGQLANQRFVKLPTHILKDDVLGDIAVQAPTTMERLASQSRADLFVEVFGRKLAFREAGVHT